MTNKLADQLDRRQRLPDRRAADAFDFVHEQRKWTATVGRFDDGRIAELFLDATKQSPLADAARESALLASLGVAVWLPRRDHPPRAGRA